MYSTNAYTLLSYYGFLPQAKCKIIQLRDDFIASEVAEKEKLIERVKELEKALH
tara:strand:- start:391 stop:552 length:162 start_codon:yes stop_codon:yes gene_type:complete